MKRRQFIAALGGARRRGGVADCCIGTAASEAANHWVLWPG
jgi:hypothetical protein